MERIFTGKDIDALRKLIKRIESRDLQDFFSRLNLVFSSNIGHTFATAESSSTINLLDISSDISRIYGLPMINDDPSWIDYPSTSCREEGAETALSSIEKEIQDKINFARSSPALFSEDLLQDASEYIELIGENDRIDEIAENLTLTEPRSELQTSHGLSKAARSFIESLEEVVIESLEIETMHT